MTPNKFRLLNTTPKKVKRSPAIDGFVKLSSSGNRVFVHCGNEGLMTVFITKVANTKESTYVKHF